MNPNNQPTEFTGHIPRKKKPPPAGFGESLVAQMAPPAAAPIPMNDISIPRKKKPKNQLSERGDRVGSHHLKQQQQHQRQRNFGGSSGSSRSLHHDSSLHRERHRNPRHHQESSSHGALDDPLEEDDMLYTGNKRICVISQDPFVVRILLKGVPLRPGTPTAVKSSQASSLGNSGSSSPVGGVELSASKRQRPAAVSYKELEDTDEEDIMTEAEEKELLLKRAKKRRKKVEPTKDSAASDDDVFMDGSMGGHLPADSGGMLVADVSAPADPSAIESPPPGVLSTLWYSRECFLHVFVLEKICGWKTRPKLELVKESDPSASNAVDGNGEENSMPVVKPSFLLDQSKAIRLQQNALMSKAIWSDPKMRMEFSRLHPTTCPTLLKMAADDSRKHTAAEGKRLKVQPVAAVAGVDGSKASREEVLLVKWRGRSYLHCSWERASDIQRLDPSTSNIARNKIRKFYQSQEAAYGPNWKQVLEEERMTAAAIHSHGKLGTGEIDSHSNVPTVVEAIEDQDEEYFSPQCLEVERILACDENEMNMEVIAKQRALNMLEEMAEIDRIEQERSLHDCCPDVPESDTAAETSEPSTWDPEDNVRYVVKWKGVPYAEITWEYWRDIKRNAVDEAEDFWYRQCPPDLEEVRLLACRPHPHMRDFKKLQESRVYGISSKAMPVAKLGKNGEDPMPASDVDPGFRLRSYQLEGVNWLLFNWWNRRSCILADEMGLGKTIQSAAFLQELQNQPAAQVRGPFLIVAPLSLIGQWESELKSWAPDINVIFYHGSADARDFLVQQEFFYTDQFIPKQDVARLKKLHVTKFHVLITTYEVVLKDIDVLSKIRWKTLIVDEAHRLKNHKAKLFEELASVPRDHCVLLTGTPIANATEELWALLHFANPRSFADRDSFLEKFGEMKGAKQVEELHALLKPYLLRRVKEDVEKSIPNKEETILEVSLTPIQKTFYKAIYERNTSFLFKGAKPNNAPSLMNVVMELRKCCNHPYLIKGAEDRILDEAAGKLQGQKDEFGNELPIDYTKLFGEQLVKASGKMVLLDKLLQKLFDGGHKVLIFSQMVRALDLLEELLKLKKYRYERLDGTTSSSSRLHAVERFKRPACERFVMLLSTRAGGLGLNLTAADIVIIFDSDFNPQNDLQAMARAHRIGQTRAVKVYRLLTAKTYEMHMFHTASLKLGLERAVLSQNREQHNDDSEDATKSTRSSEREAQAKEIDKLLKKGAYDVFRDDDDNEAEKFMDTDIDQLLEKSSKTVSYGASSISSLGSGLGSFSKASFVANTEDGEKDVDLDDPEFWSKAVGLDAPPEETPEDVAAMLDDGVKRNRKQVQQYDPYAETAMAEQLKKERVALEKMLEKEEKDRQKEEKRLRKNKAKEIQRKKQREEKEKAQLMENPTLPINSSNSKILSEQRMKAVKLPKLSRGTIPKKTKKNDRLRALQRAENEDPAIERFKQAWDIPQRNRAASSTIRFGFGRFCKIRIESNLSSLPLQDLEVFIRAYIFQLSLQVAATVLSRARLGANTPDVRLLLQEWLGCRSTSEINWLCDAISSVIHLQTAVESKRRLFRIPLILNDPVFVTDLRHGAGLRALRRVGIMARLNGFIGDCLDSILESLGHEELGKRGCSPSEFAALDVDLKARFVTFEELALAVSGSFDKLDLKAPASWWDRSCDVAFVVGTFVHGLGNYEAMLRDHSLPFSDKVKKFARHDVMCKTAALRFRSAASATRKVFDDALEAMQLKAELEVQAAVAAAAKAAAQREKDAARVREGGEAAEVAAKSMPETQVENAFEFDGTDTHFVTLPRIHRRVLEAIRLDSVAGSASLTVDGAAVEVIPDVLQSGDDFEPRTVGNPSWRTKERHILPMPDARVLDYRLMRLLEEIENDPVDSNEHLGPSNGKFWETPSDVSITSQVHEQIVSLFVSDSSDFISEYTGVGIGGNQCGLSHRTLNDGSDFSFGSASNHLAQLAYGTDAPRYLRALAVPMNITRFAIVGLVYADVSCVELLMASECYRFFGNKHGKKELESSQEPTESANITFNGSSVSLNGSAATTTAAVQHVDGKVNFAHGVTSEVKSDNGVSTSGPLKSCTPVDPVEFVDPDFRRNPKLRAFVCLAVIFYGFPSSSSSTLNLDLWHALQREGCAPDDDARFDGLFDIQRFRNVLCTMAPDVEIPNAEKLLNYVEKVLLPHCLRLCINGNGPTTRNARGSEGEYETAFGVSIHPEPSQPQPSPLPDPCLSLKEHSLEAIGFASAVLRRVRLLRSCVFLCSTATEASVNSIISVARSRDMCLLEGMPAWWCPWFHDITLLFLAATQGLFSVFVERDKHGIFSVSETQQFMHAAVVQSPVPVLQRSAPSEVSAWIAHQSGMFLSLNQLERRLGNFCSLLTVDLQHDARFDLVPMFDHGGWPRD